MRQPRRAWRSRLTRPSPTIAITSPVAGDNIINKTEAAAGVTISGTAAAGSGGAAVNGQTATITIVDGTNAVKDTYTATVTGGAWSVNVTAAQAQGLADGSYSIKANVSDAAGNAATTASQAITVDETVADDRDHEPGCRRQHHQQDRGGGRRHHQRHGRGRRGGAAVNGQTATITIVDGTNAVKDSYTATVTGGAWSVNVTAAQAQGLADGSYSIKANVSDAAGNAAATASQAIAVDTLPPAVLISTTGTTTNQATQTISGTVTTTEAAAGATVTLYDNGSTTPLGTATVSGGAWTTSVTLSGNGTHSIVARTPMRPATPGPARLSCLRWRPRHRRLRSRLRSPATTSSTRPRRRRASPSVARPRPAGAAVNGQTATITIVDGTNAVKDTYTATVTGGAWSVNVTAAQAQGLADGSYSSRRTCRMRPATRRPRQARRSRWTRPSRRSRSRPGRRRQHHQQDRGGGRRHHQRHGAAGSGGAAVNGQTATITIVDGTNAVKDTYTATVTGGAWSVNVTAAQAQGLADGSYSIKANVSDTAGNAATTASQAITVDETVPTIAITAPVAGDNIINKAEAAAGVTISGTATAAAVRRSTARPRRSRSSTAPTPSRTAIRRR